MQRQRTLRGSVAVARLAIQRTTPQARAPLRQDQLARKCLPNPGSGIDGVRLANGHWALMYNDSKSSRASLAVSLSDDEGRTWKTTRHLEKHAAGRYHYPAVIQGRDGALHAIYSCFIASEEPAVDGKKKPEMKGIKHVAFNEAWIRAGEE